MGRDVIVTGTQGSPSAHVSDEKWERHVASAETNGERWSLHSDFAELSYSLGVVGF